MYRFMTFGRYPQSGEESSPIEWLVLDRRENRKLLLSRDCLSVQTYFPVLKSVRWPESNLRGWILEIFLRRAFTEEERRLIGHPDAPSAAGGTCREDPVFVLSRSELNFYLPAAADRVALASANADELLRKRGYIHHDGTCSWWIRPEGAPNGFKQPVVRRRGNYSTFSCCDLGALVRPALWLATDDPPPAPPPYPECPPWLRFGD
ncbi:MAG: hypothetical protein IJK28_03455 [Clostridia bacterium]|nr:hypothetical protein [Clostridia bacterium]